MTPYLVELLRRALAEGTSTTFLRDGGKNYVRYDSLRISRKVSEHKKGIFGTEKYSTHIYTVEFLLNGGPVTYQEIKNVHFADGDTLTLSDLNGIFEIKLDGAA